MDRPPKAKVDPRAAQLDPSTIFVGFNEAKSGTTIYILYPGDYMFLDKHAPELSAAGYKVMRGCLRWSRKSDPPLAPVQNVLRALRSEDKFPRK